jgi:HlyD family secretion protein
MYLRIILSLMILIMLNSCHWKKHHTVSGYVEGELIYLASPFYGILQHLAVHRGQEVKKGQIVYALDANPQKMMIVAAKAELAQAQSTLDDLQQPRRPPEIQAIQAQIEQTKAQITLAELRVARFQKLYGKGAIDKDSLDVAATNLQQQQDLKMQYESNLALAQLGSRDFQIKAQIATVKALNEKLIQAQWELAQKTSQAPGSGVIFDTYYREGELVVASQPVASLLTPDNIRIEFFIPVGLLAQIHVGQEVVFNCEGCEKDSKAVISYISPDAEYIPPLVYSRENQTNLIFRIKARIKSPKLFKPGQPVEVIL